MCPSIMGFHRLHWDFSASAVYVGIYYQAIANLVQKYSDPCASLYSRLKSTSDKSRLEIFRILKASEFNGLDLREAGLGSYHHLLSHEHAGARGLCLRQQAWYRNLLHPEHRFPPPLCSGAGAFSAVRPVAAPNESEAFQSNPHQQWMKQQERACRRIYILQQALQHMI